MPKNLETDSTILSVKNLGISFLNEGVWSKAVEDISFNVNRGETIGIVGESGSGKSVTSLSILKLLPQGMSRIDRGSIIYNNSDLLLLKESESRKIRGNKISMIFQEPMTSLNPVMKCGKQITESLKLHLKYSEQKAKEYTLKLFQDVMLPDPAYTFNAYPHQLSGGQKQRVMIAMAISCSPEILIADEPTTALDVTVQKSILKLLKDLQLKYKLSLIFISHDLGVVSEIADHLIVMQKGHIVEQGLSNEIFSNPNQPYTKGLLACRPSMKIRLRKLPTVSDFIDNDKHPQLVIASTSERELHHKSLYSTSPILEVSNLSVHYPLPKKWFANKREYFKAVDDVSFEAYKGETLGLVGESGCGKTTLGRALLRLIEPTSGSIKFEGKDLLALKQDQIRVMRKRMQIVFQDPYSSLNPRLTIGQSIIEPLNAHHIGSSLKSRKQKVMELLERVNLSSSYYNRYPHQFSGGQRQRICIARALVLNPDFIICDESVSALDVSVQAQVLNLLNDLKKEFGFTYIFISHDLSVVKFMSDRMLVMKNGQIIERGEADAIYESPQQEYTRLLIDAIPGKSITHLV
ncbi:MAG: ABC transporter ATP-binding protein [Omnitrophica WOR_2 bacterium]|jgi:peptide/nickel transport system ATP-binding protein